MVNIPQLPLYFNYRIFLWEPEWALPCIQLKGRYCILLLFGWAFTRQLTYFLRALMLYNSPLDSLSACCPVTRQDWWAVIESKYPDLCAPPPQIQHSPGFVFMQ